ncbi:MAG: SLBB domain-containing protein, partial [Bacteroidota bacterium]
MRFNLILFIAIITCLWCELHAQQAPSAAQEAQLRSELQRRGLDEEELKTRLLTIGLNVDQMSAEELLAAQPQIEAVVAQLEAEKEAAEESAQMEAERRAAALAARQSEAIQDAVASGATVEEAISETTTDVLQRQQDVPNIWGHALFKNQSLQVYRTTDNVRPPETYRLGVGDEVAVSIFGASQADLKMMIGQDGFITPPNMPRIYLKGITLGKARELVESRFQQFYVFREGQFTFNIDAARTITVNIFGETERNGSFTISAVNTAFNALVAAGGPTENGSVRKIKILRGGKESFIDVYEFLLDPTRQADFFLENNDIIFVPTSETVVSIAGAIKRPLRYELLPEETLADAIEYAGGLLPQAAPTAVTIRRRTGDEINVIDADLTAEGSGLRLQSSDVITVGSRAEPRESFVAISGAVALPGAYAFTPDMTARDLIEKGRLTEESRLDIAYLRRKNPDGTAALLPLSINEVQNNT